MKPILKNITPDIAEEMLLNNTGNRALNLRHVDRLAKEIKAGRYKINGDMIRLSKNGRVLDGQHRLNAVIKSGIPIQSWVMEDMSDDIFDTIDQLQKTRSAGDTLSCLGNKNAFRLAAALILVDKYMTGRVEKSVIYSNGEIEELLVKYPEVKDSIHTNLNGKKLFMPSVMDACHYLFSRKNSLMADRFMGRLIRGNGLEEGEPEYVLREKLVSNSLSKAKLSKAYIFALVIKAWNHRRAGKTIHALRLNEREGKYGLTNSLTADKETALGQTRKRQSNFSSPNLALNKFMSRAKLFQHHKP